MRRNETWKSIAEQYKVQTKFLSLSLSLKRYNTEKKVTSIEKPNEKEKLKKLLQVNFKSEA